MAVPSGDRASTIRRGRHDDTAAASRARPQTITRDPALMSAVAHRRTIHPIACGTSRRSTLARVDGTERSHAPMDAWHTQPQWSNETRSCLDQVPYARLELGPDRVASIRIKVHDTIGTATPPATK